MSGKLIFLALFVLVNSGIVLSNPQASTQQHPTPNTNNPSSNNEQTAPKTPEPVGVPAIGTYNGYTNRVNGPLSNANAYPTYAAYAPQDQSLVFGRPPANQQIFGIASNGDFSLSAYFGPIFWGCLSGIIVVGLLFWLLSAVGGLGFLGGLLTKNEEKGLNGKKGGKSIDMDKLSAMVHTAIDTYGKWKVNNYDKFA